MGFLGSAVRGSGWHFETGANGCVPAESFDVAPARRLAKLKIAISSAAQFCERGIFAPNFRVEDGNASDYLVPTTTKCRDFQLFVVPFRAFGPNGCGSTSKPGRIFTVCVFTRSVMVCLCLLILAHLSEICPLHLRR